MDRANSFTSYASRLSGILQGYDWRPVAGLARAMTRIWEEGNQLFLCGNGGSAGNAIHLANDFLYGVGGGEKPGLKVEALSANSAVITCLANDVGYEWIFAEQLKAKGTANDILLILSGKNCSGGVIRTTVCIDGILAGSSKPRFSAIDKASSIFRI